MTVNHIPISSISNRTNNIGGDKKAGLAPNATGQILKNSTWNHALGKNGKANGAIYNNNKYLISHNNQVGGIGLRIPFFDKGVNNSHAINRTNRALKQGTNRQGGLHPTFNVTIVGVTNQAIHIGSNQYRIA